MVTIRNIGQDHVSPSSNYLANKSVSYLHSSALKSTKFFVYILSSKFSVLCLCNAMRQYHSELKIKNLLAKELFTQVHTAIHIHKANGMECNANNSIDLVRSLWNQTSLHYFRVKLSCVCIMFAYRKKLPIVTLGLPTVTLKWPIVTLRWPIVTLHTSPYLHLPHLSLIRPLVE